MARHFDPRRVKLHYSYTIDEAARALGAHKHTVRAWTVAGGLPLVRRQRPVLIAGSALRDFLSARRARSKVELGPGQIYCLSCRSPKTPAGLMADYKPLTAYTGNLAGLCPDCDRLIHRVVSLSKIDVVRGNLDIAFPQALERIRQTTSTR
jgi:excisionase family DNA binding protein